MTTGDAVLVIDAGTSGVRAAIVTADGSVAVVAHREVLPSSPLPNFVEFDPVELRDATLAVAGQVLSDWGGAVAGVGITNQRASTVLWDRGTGEPVGPGVGWQDLRTAGMCLMLREQGLRVAPNASATKLAFLLDLADAGRERAEAGALAFGTVDTWLAWCLTEGRVHATDWSNACVTGLVEPGATGWSAKALELLRVPDAVLPTIADSAEVLGEATALAGAPPLAGLAGDQQASLMGQGCVKPGQAKATFGTGGMLDLNVGAARPAFEQRGEHGTLPLVAWRLGGDLTWCGEAVMLTAGTCVEWLRDDLGLISSAAESAEVAAGCDGTDGVVFVPALLGLGTPAWDFGARGTLLGLTRGSGRAEVVRAVLEGIAHRGADLLESAEADTGHSSPELRVDGGMAANDVFVQALADACGRPVALAPVTEATTLGAAHFAGIATGVWTGPEETAALAVPSRVVEPSMSEGARATARDRWHEAVRRAGEWVPELSTLDF